MGLRRPAPSPATWKAYKVGLKEMQRLQRAPLDLGPIVYPQRIHVMDLEQVVAGKGLDHAKPVAWQFLRGSVDGPAVGVVVIEPPDGQAPRMTSLARGKLWAQAIKDSKGVAELPKVKGHDYQLRRLRIPGLVGTYWLKSEGRHPDLIIPYHAIIKTLKRMYPYIASEFFSLILPLAKKRLKQAHPLH